MIIAWQIRHPYGRKRRGTEEPLDESEKESVKAGLKLNIQKKKEQSQRGDSHPTCLLNLLREQG